MVAALKARGIDVPYIVKDNEGHGFRNEENQFDVLRGDGAVPREAPRSEDELSGLRRGCSSSCPAAGGGSRFGSAHARSSTRTAGGRAVDLRSARPPRRARRRRDRRRDRARRRGVTRASFGDAPGRRGAALRRNDTRADTVAQRAGRSLGRCGPHDWILVHDAARPCVPRDALQRLVERSTTTRSAGCSRCRSPTR